MNKSLVTNLVALAVIALGYFSPYFGKQILSVGFFALSGAVTNWLAVYMLFEKVPLLYGSGVVPLHFEEFKNGIRHLIMSEFFTRDNLGKFLAKSEESLMPKLNIDKALEAVDYDKAFDSLVDVILDSQFGGMLGMFGGKNIFGSFRKPFEEKIKEFVKSETEKKEFRQALSESFNKEEMVDKIETQIKGIIEGRLDELTPQMVKRIIQDMIKKHLGWLVIWGGVFGGLIGLAMSFVR